MNEYSRAAFLHTPRRHHAIVFAIEGAILIEYSVTNVPWNCALG